MSLKVQWHSKNNTMGPVFPLTPPYWTHHSVRQWKHLRRSCRTMWHSSKNVDERPNHVEEHQVSNRPVCCRQLLGLKVRSHPWQATSRLLLHLQTASSWHLLTRLRSDFLSVVWLAHFWLQVRDLRRFLVSPGDAILRFFFTPLQGFFALPGRSMCLLPGFSGLKGQQHISQWASRAGSWWKGLSPQKKERKSLGSRPKKKESS